eukprot:380405_1
MSQSVTNEKSKCNLSTHQKRIQLIVSGYIRQSTYKMDLLLQIIFPIDLINVIFYYCNVCDTWNSQLSSDILDIKGGIVEMKNGKHSHVYNASAYGNSIIEPGQGSYTWTFKLLKYVECGQKYYPYIGIIHDNEETLKKYKKSQRWFDKPVSGYQLCCGNGNIRPNEENFCHKCVEADIIEMTFDPINMELSYKINDKDLGIAFSNIIKRKYRLAIALYNKAPGSQLEML